MRYPFASRISELGLVFAILSGVCFIAYSNGLHNAFMLDDGPIFSDIKIHNIKFLPNAFFYPTRHSDQLDSFIASNYYYRPMAYIITLLSYHFLGEDPFGYHVLNLFLFALMCLTLYVFIDTFFKNKALAFISSLLFALHPINVFFVDYITSGIHSFRFILMFMSLIFFLKDLGVAALACFILTLLCHETCIVLPFYAVFAVFYFKGLNFKEAVFKSWPYGCILLLYLLFRFQCTGLGSTLPAVHINPLVYFATFSKIIFLYVSKLFCPQGIVFFWNSPWMTGANTFIWIAGFCVVLGGWALLFKANPRGINSFCATWLLLGFIPVFLAACPPYDKIFYGLIIEPQWLTFSSVGFFVYIASIGLALYARWKKGMLLILILLLIVLTSQIRRYNGIWGDEYQYYFYWSQQIKPLPAINNGYLADFYARKKEYGQAGYYFSKALNKKPDASLYYNLGLTDAKEGHMQKAREKFLLSIAADPGFYKAYNNLGVIYFDQGDYPAAKKAFLRTITLDRYCIEARSNLGLIALLQSDYGGAVDYYKANLDIVPGDEASLLGLVQAYAGLKDFDDMDKYSDFLLSHGKDPDILDRLRKFLAAKPQERTNHL